jgi:hypothetical protein
MISRSEGLISPVVHRDVAWSAFGCADEGKLGSKARKSTGGVDMKVTLDA